MQLSDDFSKRLGSVALALLLLPFYNFSALPVEGASSYGGASDTMRIAQDSHEGDKEPEDGERPDGEDMDGSSALNSGRSPRLDRDGNETKDAAGSADGVSDSGAAAEPGSSPASDSGTGVMTLPPIDPLVEPASQSTALDPNAAANVETIVGKAIEAMGDAAALRKLEKTMTIVGKLIPASGEAASAYTYKKYRKGKKWRVDLESPSKPGQVEPKRILAYNGLAGWRSSGTVAEDLNSIRLRQLNDDNERAHTIIAKLNNPDYKFSLLGATTFRQIPVYAVTVEHAGDTPTTVYIDKRNFQVDGISYDTTDPTETGARKISIEYSEYRPISGTMFPYRQIKYIGDKAASEIVVTSLSSSTEIDDAVFDRPQSADKVHLNRAIVVPFDYQQKEILVKGRINSGEEVIFLFDTGASDTIIDRRMAAESFLMKEGQSGMMSLAGRVDVNNTVLKRLELGSLVLNDVDARIANLAGQSQQLGKKIAGIIGTNVMAKAVVRIDFGKPNLTFYDKDSYVLPKGAAIIPLVQQNAPVVKAKINGADEVWMLADTGAAFNNLPTDIAKKLLTRASGQETHTTEGSGLDGRRIKLGNVVARSVAVGPHSVANMNFTYTVANAGGSTKPEAGKGVEAKEGFFQSNSIGILGNPFWENFIVTVDYKFQRLLLEPNPGVRLRGEIGKAMDQGDQKVFVYSDYRAGEILYQKGLLLSGNGKDVRNEALLWGRMANMRRMMAKELQRPEHARAAYDYFVKAVDLARKAGARDVEGRILADWSLLYMDNGQQAEARQTINQAVMMAPQDSQVNLDYALHLAKDSNFIEMQKYLDKALFLEPSNWQALWCQFKLSEKFVDYPKGIAILKEILRYYPWSKMASAKLVEYQAYVRDAKSQPKVPGAVRPGAITPYSAKPGGAPPNVVKPPVVPNVGLPYVPRPGVIQQWRPPQ